MGCGRLFQTGFPSVELELPLDLEKPPGPSWVVNRGQVLASSTESQGQEGGRAKPCCGEHRRVHFPWRSVFDGHGLLERCVAPSLAEGRPGGAGQVPAPRASSQTLAAIL